MKPAPLLALAALLAGPLAAAPPPLPAAAGVRLSPAELTRLAAGEVLVRLEDPAVGGLREGIGVGIVDFPPARVFAALADFGHWSEFMPFLRRSEARREPDGSFLCDQSLDLPGGLRRYRVRATARAAAGGAGSPWRIAWGYVPGSGDLRAQRGSWTLVPWGAGRTLAVLRLASDPGGVAAWLAQRATAKSIPWIFNGLRQHAGRGRYAGLGGIGPQPASAPAGRPSPR